MELLTHYRSWRLTDGVNYKMVSVCSYGLVFDKNLFHLQEGMENFNMRLN